MRLRFTTWSSAHLYSTHLDISDLGNEPGLSHPQSKIDHNHGDKANADDGRSPFLVVDALDVASFADFVHAPDVQHKTVD